MPETTDTFNIVINIERKNMTVVLYLGVWSCMRQLAELFGFVRKSSIF